MVAFIARHLDRVPYLHHVKSVRFDRIHRQNLESGGRGRRAAGEPAGAAAHDERRQGGRDRAVDPFARLLHQPLDLEPLRHGFVDDRIVPRMQRFRHRAPRMHPLGIVGMRGEPRLDIATALRRQLVVDVSMQLVFGDGNVAIGHCRRLCLFLILRLISDLTVRYVFIISPAAAPCARLPAKL